MEKNLSLLSSRPVDTLVSKASTLVVNNLQQANYQDFSLPSNAVLEEEATTATRAVTLMKPQDGKVAMVLEL